MTEFTFPLGAPPPNKLTPTTDQRYGPLETFGFLFSQKPPVFASNSQAKTPSRLRIAGRDLEFAHSDPRPGGVPVPLHRLLRNTLLAPVQGQRSRRPDASGPTRSLCSLDPDRRRSAGIAKPTCFWAEPFADSLKRSLGNKRSCNSFAIIGMAGPLATASAASLIVWASLTTQASATFAALPATSPGGDNNGRSVKFHPARCPGFPVGARPK